MVKASILYISLFRQHIFSYKTIKHAYKNIILKNTLTSHSYVCIIIIYRLFHGRHCKDIYLISVSYLKDMQPLKAVLQRT